MNKKQAKRVTVDYAHIEEIKTLPCVHLAYTEPRIEVHVRSELTPEWETVAHFGDTIEVETRRRCPWVQPWMSAEQFGKVFANKRLTPEEGGEDDTREG